MKAKPLDVKHASDAQLLADALALAYELEELAEVFRRGEKPRVAAQRLRRDLKELSMRGEQLSWRIG